MLGMGWQEILLILVVAVLVIGPDQLPQVARTIGRVVAQFRRMANDLRDQMNREFTGNEDLKDFREFQQSIDSEVRGIGYTAQDYVEKEVAKEEAELKKLEQEVREQTDPGLPGGSPGDPQTAWSAAAHAFPAEEPPPGPAAEAAPRADGNGSAAAEAEPVERAGTRKESA